MALDNYDPSTALSAYYPTRDERRPARLWATEKLLHDMAELGMVDFFEGAGTDPTGLDGYDIAKAWLQVSSGVTEQPGKIRLYDGSGDASDVANWPELTPSSFVSLLGAVAKAGDTMSGLLSIARGDATTNQDFLRLVPTDFGAGKPFFGVSKSATADRWDMYLWDGADTGGTIGLVSDLFDVVGRQSIAPPTPSADETAATLTITHYNQRPQSAGIMSGELPIPGSVAKSAILVDTIRTGGEGAYGNILEFYKVAAPINNYELDCGLSIFAVANDLNGGQIFGIWGGANSPASYISGHNVNMTPGATGVVGMEIDAGNRWGDMGYQDAPATGQADWFTTGIAVSPDVLPVNGEGHPEYPTHLYPGSFGINITRSVHGHRWWIATTVPYDTLMPDGVGFNLAGSSTNSDIPGIGYRAYGYFHKGLDLTDAIITTTAINLADEQIIGWGDNETYLYGNGEILSVGAQGVGGGVNIQCNSGIHYFCEGGVGIEGSLGPNTNDGGALGASDKGWSDLFLASGGVLNWNNGNVVQSHAANAMAFDATYDGTFVSRLRNNSAGTSAAAHLVMNCGTQELTIGIGGENNSSGSAIAFYTGQAIDMSFYTNNLERLRLLSSGHIHLPTGLVDAANDAAAASAGVATGGLYRNGSVVMIRVS